jgi:transposase
MLMPVDKREWLAEDHPVRLLIFLVERVLDTSQIVAGWARLGGRGRAAYDPVMLITLLLWAGLDAGEQSCEKIVSRCRRDVAYQYVCGEHVPDEDTVRRFRQHMFDRVAVLEAEVLRLAALAGIGDFSLAAVDGTKMLAAASMKANRTEPTLVRLAEQLASESAPGLVAGSEPEPPAGKPARVAAALGQVRAERLAADAAEAARVAAYRARRAASGPPGSAPRSIRLAEAEAQLATLIARQQAKLAAWQAQQEAAIAAGRGGIRNPKPKVHDHYKVIKKRRRVEQLRAEAAAEISSKPGKRRGDSGPARANLTDPDSAVMPTARGFVQGYNCQAVATWDRLLVAGSAGRQTGDVGQAVPMLAAVEAAVELFTATRRAAGFCCTCRHDQPEPDRHTEPDQHARWRAAIDGCELHHGLRIDWMLLDAGYLSEDNLSAAGPPRLIALGKTRDLPGDDEPPAGPPDPEATAHEQNAHNLRTREGRLAYRLRGHIAESPYGHLKHNKGLNRFHTRGLPAVTAEWTFIRTCHNLGITLHTIQTSRTNPRHLAVLAHTTRQTMLGSAS